MAIRISAISYGSEGDCRPLASLCAGLAAVGHEVVLFAESSAASYASGGFGFVPLPGALAAATAALAATVSPASYARDAVRVGSELARAHASEWLRTLIERSQGADAVLCGGLATFTGLSCAEALRIPAILTALQPLRPTREFSTPLAPPLRLPAWANVLTHRLALTAMRRHFREANDKARRQVAGLPLARPQPHGSPMLVGISPTLVPKPRDWPAEYHVVGYWWPREDPAWRPDGELAAFLAAGEPPVYVGFGSMVLPERDHLQALVLEAVGKRRVLLATGWGSWIRAVPGNVRLIGPTPHAWLFPRVAVAIHHGGAGTTHAAARAGVPSVAVPFFVDQAFWGDRVQRLGTGSKPVPVQRQTAARFGAALREAAEPAIAAHAREVAQAIAHEDSVAAAVALIQRIVSRSGLRHDRHS